MKFIITLVFLISLTFAQSMVNITSDTSSITDFKLDYFIDKTQKMDFEEIKSQKFTQGMNKDCLGKNIVNIDANFTKISSPDYIYYINDKNNTYSPSIILHSKVLKQARKMHIGSRNNPFWTRVSIKNRSNKTQNISLFNPLAGMNAIDVYIYKDDTLIKSHSLGDMREQSKREVVTRLSMFNLTLLAGESVVVVSKIENYIIYNISLSIQKSELFMKNENYFIFGMAFWGEIGIFIFIFAFFMIYKQKAYLVLSLYFIMIILNQYSFHGILYLLDSGINLKLISILPWLSHLIRSEC